MKFLILFFLFVYNKSYCQHKIVQAPVEERDYTIPTGAQPKKLNSVNDTLRQSASKLAWQIINQEKWNYAFSSSGVREWYIAKEIISKTENKIKIKIMTYFPEFEIGKIIYKDVILEQTMLFDCENKMYKIIDGTYYSDFYKLVDIFDNLKGDIKKTIPKTIFNGLQDLACDKFIK